MLASTVAAGATWGGCGGQAFTENATGEDAGADVVQETMTDAPSEATQDVAPDAKPDVAPDAKPDVMPDVVIDAKPDALQDAKPDVTPDAKPDVAPDASPLCEDTPVPASACTADGNCAVQAFVAPQGSTYNFGIDTDGVDVYWAAQDDYNGVGTGVIKRLAANKAGQTPEMFTKVHDRPFSVAIGSEYIY